MVETGFFAVLPDVREVFTSIMASSVLKSLLCLVLWNAGLLLSFKDYAKYSSIVLYRQRIFFPSMLSLENISLFDFDPAKMN